MKKYLAALLLAPLTTWAANTVISTDTIYNSGSFLPDTDAILFVTDGSNNPTLTLDNGVSASWEGATVIGELNGESGNLEILGGSVLSNEGNPGMLAYYPDDNIAVIGGSGYLGFAWGSQGSALVSGVGSKWEIWQQLYVGYSGNGMLQITDGGAVSAGETYVGRTSQGLLAISGAGSINSSLYVGVYSNGTLEITDGGRASGSFGYVGLNNGSQGSALVSDVGSKWEIGNLLAVGHSGKGTLQITNGGEISSVSGNIGYNVGGEGEVTVSGAGSKWENSDNIYVGYSGKGTLQITNGGEVFSQYGGLGVSDYTSEGLVMVNGTGSKWKNSGFLTIGSYGKGELRIENGGEVFSQYGGLGVSDYTSEGLVKVDGMESNWEISRELYIGTYGKGTLEITDGGVVSSEAAYIGQNSGSAGFATVKGAGSEINTGDLILGGNTLSNQTTATGELTIADGGKVTVNATTRVHGGGTIHIEENSTLETETLISNGEVIIFGSLVTTNEVTVNASGILGGGGEIDGDLTLAAGAKFQFTLGATLTVTGSVSLDGSFGIDDLLGLDGSIALGSYTLIDGTATDFASLNIENWGIENAYDLGEGKSAYFRQGSLTVEVIPEPTGILLLLFGMSVCLTRRRRTRESRA